MMDMPCVYIAGPYTLGDVGENVRAAMEAAHAVMDLGCAPIVPHLSHFLHLHRPRPYEDWTRADVAILALCDVVVRLPGPSAGADAEVRVAARRGIPVCDGLPQLAAWIAQRQADDRP